MSAIDGFGAPRVDWWPHPPTVQAMSCGLLRPRSRSLVYVLRVLIH